MKYRLQFADAIEVDEKGAMDAKKLSRVQPFFLASA